MTTITINYQSNGARKTVSELQRLQAGLDSTADGAVSLARSLGISLGEAQKFARNLGVTTQSAAQQVQRFKELRAVQANAGQSFRILNEELGVSRRQFLALQGAVQTVEEAIAEADKATGLINENLRDLITGIAQGFGQGVFSAVASSLESLTGNLGDFISESITVARTNQGIERSLLGVSNSAEITATDLEFLRQVADDLGLDATELGDSFRGFAAATRTADPSVPVSQIRDVFESTIRASRLLGASTEDINGTLEALSQIASKGTVQMEELRGQLGERLPVALSATAQGLGITIGELEELISAGDLTAQEFFPAFVKGLEDVQGEAPAGAQAVGQLGNTLGDLQNTIGETLIPLQTGLVNAANDVLETFTALPVPIQRSLILFGGFSGVLGTTVAAIVAARTALVQLGIAQTAATIKENVLTAARTAKNIVTNKATASELAYAKALATTAATAAAVGGAIAVIAANLIELERIQSVGEEIEDAIKSVNNEFETLNALLDQTPETFEESRDRIEDRVEQNVNALREDITGISGVFESVRVQLERVLGDDFLITGVEDALDRQTIAFSDFADDARQQLASIQDLDLGALDDEQLLQAQRALRALNTELEGSNAGTLVEVQEQLTEETARRLNLVQEELDLRDQFSGLDQEALQSRQDVIAETERTLAEETAFLNEELAQRLISQEEFNAQSLALEQEGLQRRLQANQQAAQAISKAIASGTLEGDALKDAQDQLTELETETFELRSDIARNTADARIAEEERAKEELERIVEETRDAIALAETERLTEIQRQLNEGVISQQQADQQRINSTRERLEAELQAEEQQLARLRAAAASGDEEAEDALSDSLQNVAQLQLDLLENEAAARQAVTDQAIQQIRDRAAAEQIASDRNIRNLEAETAQLEIQERSIQSLSNLLDERLNLQQALNRLSETRADVEIGGLREALSLAERLEGTESNRVRQVIQARLRELGVSGDVQDIAVAIAEAEEDRAKNRLIELQQEQFFERQSLEFQIQSNELASQRAITEARIAELRAQSDVIQAEADLEAAQQITDPAERARQTEAAQAQLDAAQQIAQLSGDQVGAAQEQLDATREAGELQQQALEAQQESARILAEEAIEAAEFATELAEAEASSRGIANNLNSISIPALGGIQGRRMGGPVTAGTPYIVGEGPGGRIGQNAEVFMPGVSGRILANKELRRVLAATQYTPSAQSLSMASFSRPSASNPLLTEMKALRKDLKRLPTGQQFFGPLNMPQTIQLERDEDSMQRAIANHWRQFTRDIQSYRGRRF